MKNLHIYLLRILVLVGLFSGGTALNWLHRLWPNVVGYVTIGSEQLSTARLAVHGAACSVRCCSALYTSPVGIQPAPSSVTPMIPNY